MVQYDGAVLQQFANKLYAKASFIAGMWGIAGAIAGGVAGHFIDLKLTNAGGLYWLFFLLVGAAAGLKIGESIALVHRVKAQEALCQVEIEKSIRALLLKE